MERDILFTIRINAQEKALISSLAASLQRTQSDAVRFVVVNAARELAAQNQLAVKAISQTQGVQNASNS